MRLISKGKLIAAAAKYPDALKAVEQFYEIFKETEWQNLEQAKQTFSSAEAVGNFTVFNIRGNKYRLILAIQYDKRLAYFKYFLTHAEYDKDKWKNDPYY